MSKAARCMAAILVVTATGLTPATARADNGNELMLQMCYYLAVNPSPQGVAAILTGMIKDGYTYYGASGVLNTATARFCPMYSLLARQFGMTLT